MHLLNSAAVVLLIAMTLASVVCGQAAAQEKLSISYPSVASTGGVVPWIAKERGFFLSRGIDAELIYTSGALSMQALIGGS
ncbi:MAG TPA: hypothetical protein VHL99_01465, partial [Candidatus Binatia bacterium]|nr:hypothetical protein [Candidatus Binatia bacterium]